MTIFNRNKEKGLTGISQESIECLSNYPWPGNIRELENLVERLSILKGQGQIEMIDLPTKYRSAKTATAEIGAVDIPDNGMDFNSAVDAYENALILRALEKTGWNRNQAAALLRLNRTTLVEKIKKKGLTPPNEILI
ncbi:Nitrogen assimilation regulatory protein [compost metagenome]